MTGTATVRNPATEQVIAEVPLAGLEEADEAVARAEVAAPGWRAVSPADRARLLRRFAALIDFGVDGPLKNRLIFSGTISPF